MGEGKPIVMLVEDDAEMARLNSRFLSRNGYSVTAAGTAAQARALFRETAPDLIVLDVELPDGTGYALCKEFRKDTDAPIIFLTGRKENKDRIMGLSMSGDYYLTKPFENAEFLLVVRNLLRRHEQSKARLDEASVIVKGPLTLRLDERKAYVGEADAELTPKEFAVLLLLVQNEDREVSYETIYERVWGMPLIGSVGALRQQILRLRRKLGEEESDGFSIFNEHGKGYTFTVG